MSFYSWFLDIKVCKFCFVKNELSRFLKVGELKISILQVLVFSVPLPPEAPSMCLKGSPCASILGLPDPEEENMRNIMTLAHDTSIIIEYIIGYIRPIVYYLHPSCGLLVLDQLLFSALLAEALSI